MVRAMSMAFLSAPTLSGSGEDDGGDDDELDEWSVILAGNERLIGREVSVSLTVGHDLATGDGAGFVGSHEVRLQDHHRRCNLFLNVEIDFFFLVSFSEWKSEWVLYLGKWQPPKFTGGQSSKNRQVCPPASAAPCPGGAGPKPRPSPITSGAGRPGRPARRRTRRPGTEGGADRRRTTPG